MCGQAGHGCPGSRGDMPTWRPSSPFPQPQAFASLALYRPSSPQRRPPSEAHTPCSRGRGAYPSTKTTEAAWGGHGTSELPHRQALLPKGPDSRVPQGRALGLFPLQAQFFPSQDIRAWDPEQLLTEALAELKAQPVLPAWEASGEAGVAPWANCLPEIAASRQRWQPQTPGPPWWRKSSSCHSHPAATGRVRGQTPGQQGRLRPLDHRAGPHVPTLATVPCQARHLPMWPGGDVGASKSRIRSTHWTPAHRGCSPADPPPTPWQPSTYAALPPWVPAGCTKSWF